MRSHATAIRYQQPVKSTTGPTDPDTTPIFITTKPMIECVIQLHFAEIFVMPLQEYCKANAREVVAMVAPEALFTCRPELSFRGEVAFSKCQMVMPPSRQIQRQRRCCNT